MYVIMDIVKPLEDAGLLTKSINESNENESKEKKWISLHVTWYIRCYLVRKFFNM